jgi:hypothetical protein
MILRELEEVFPLVSGFLKSVRVQAVAESTALGDGRTWRTLDISIYWEPTVPSLTFCHEAANAGALKHTNTVTNNTCFMA